MIKKLSIVTINYNNLEGLKRTMDSVINQSWQEFEYIVIDGGSNDGSIDYIENQSHHIDYWLSEPDRGIYNAMNKGIGKASGEYLLFLNSGDHFFSNEVLKENHQFVKQFDLVYFNLYVRGNNFSKKEIYPETLRFSDLFFGYLPHPATFIKKELFGKVGLYDENLKIVSDWKFFIVALFIHRCTYKKIDQILSTFYKDGISSRTDSQAEKNAVLNEFFSSYVLDYELFKTSNYNFELLKTNSYRMHQEINKSFLGRKLTLLFFRTYIFFFSKKKLKDILK